MTTSTAAIATAPSTSPTAAPAVPAKAAAATTKATAKPPAAAKQPKKAATKPVGAATKKKTPSAKPVPTKAAAPAATRDAKAKKPKLVRDSFTIPKDEYAVIEVLKQRSAALAQPVKKSELLRAGLKVLAAMSDAALRSAVQSVPSIKTGRPKVETEAAPAAAVPANKATAKAARK